MEWHIAERTRCDIYAFSGLNLSGERKLARLFPSGRQGASLEGFSFRSCIIAAPIGTRVCFRTTVAEEDWTERPWRSISVLKGKCVRNKDGLYLVRVPSLDLYDKPDARRTDPDFEQSFPVAADLAAGTGWTFGRPGSIGQRVAAIQVEKLPTED